MYHSCITVCGIDRCNGTSFGKKAANQWSNLMQKAEGPEDFQNGYLLMRRVLAGDEARLEYLEDLYDDVKKAFFKGNLPFCNGVLVDMCETLFSAVKTWVSGRCNNKRVTLLMAFVRICHGVYQMAVAGFLSPVADAMKKTSSPNPQVSSMFRVFCKKLTTRAVTDMFRSLQRKWGSYDVTSRMDLSIQLVSNAGDVFVVDNHFKCKCKVNDGWRTCWQQSHSGRLCNHALRACVHLLNETEDSEDRKEIIHNAVHMCDKNWLRSTYRSSPIPDNLPQPVPLVVSVEQLEKDLRWAQYVMRFRDVMRFLSPEVVERYLFSMESFALSNPGQEDMDEVVTTEETSAGEISDESSSVVSVNSNTQSSVVSDSSAQTDASSTQSSARISAVKRTRPRVLVSNPARRRRRRANYIAIVNNNDV